MIKQPWKLLGFVWGLPVTIFGLLYMLILGAKWLSFEPEDWTFHFYMPEGGRGMKLFARFNVGGQTCGSVIVYGKLAWSVIPSLVKHERVHAHQGMKFGIFHPIFYGLMSLLAWMYGQDIYRGNEAEEQARYETGEVKMPDDIKPKDHTGGKL